MHWGRVRMLFPGVQWECCSLGFSGDAVHWGEWGCCSLGFSEDAVYWKSMRMLCTVV